MGNGILILGAGISGISCAYHLAKAGVSSKIIEKDDQWGGLCGNFKIDGFRFDRFVHFTFTKNDFVRKIFEDSVDCYSHKPEASNYYMGKWLRHPAQNNLEPLDTEEKINIIKDFIEKDDEDIKNLKNYEEWLRIQYGDYFAENFPMRYTRKYWTVNAKDLGVSWVGKRMHKSKIEEVLKGAMEENKSVDYYTNVMRYPEKGGYKSLLNGMSQDLNIELNSSVMEIDPENKILKIGTGESLKYETLISSIPLPEIVKLIKSTPSDILEAANRLKCTSGYQISIGFNKPSIPKKLWFYIYDEDILPSRVYSPSMKSLDNVPDGCSSIQAEVYFSKDLNLNKTPEEILELTISKLSSMMDFDESDIVVKDIRAEKYANVIFDHDIYINRKKVRDYLSSIGIETIGRFGEWDYLWSDQSLLSGYECAEKIIQSI